MNYDQTRDGIMICVLQVASMLSWICDELGSNCQISTIKFSHDVC
jgi:hypothetical protein